jgi:cell wall-associated NlpC family hydrolase
MVGRLTQRDRTICRLLYEHRVLTTSQIADVGFASLRKAQERMALLHRLEVADHFRPRSWAGTGPYHHTLGPAGAAVIAAERGVEVRDLPWRRDAATALAASQRLGHLTSPGTRIALAAGALVVFVALLGASAAAGLAGALDLAGAPAPSTTALRSVPAGYLALYQQAAGTCPGLPWTILAAIGTVESDNGRNDGPSSAGALGPMQFLPATFAAYDQPVPPGGANPPTPWDPTDAVYAAARDLCANGAHDDTDLSGAIWAYNHSTAYVNEVLGPAATYGQGDLGASSAAAATTAVDWALAQVGTPYVWGGETPGVGFDCSGLVQAAYRAAGVTLPRTAQTQFDAGSHLPSGSPLVPGDLVFFGRSASTIDHVGIHEGARGGQALMVDAPHTGADVRVEPFPTTVDGPFGDLRYLGATAPG